jgi:hypothetical protein
MQAFVEQVDAYPRRGSDETLMPDDRHGGIMLAWRAFRMLGSIGKSPSKTGSAYEIAGVRGADGDLGWVAGLLVVHREEVMQRWVELAAPQPFHFGRRDRARCCAGAASARGDGR